MFVIRVDDGAEKFVTILLDGKESTVIFMDSVGQPRWNSHYELRQKSRVAPPLSLSNGSSPLSARASH